MLVEPAPLALRAARPSPVRSRGAAQYSELIRAEPGPLEDELAAASGADEEHRSAEQKAQAGEDDARGAVESTLVAAEGCERHEFDFLFSLARGPGGAGCLGVVRSGRCSDRCHLNDVKLPTAQIGEVFLEWLPENLGL